MSWKHTLENNKLHLLLGCRAASQSFLKHRYYDQDINLPTTRLGSLSRFGATRRNGSSTIRDDIMEFYPSFKKEKKQFEIKFSYDKMYPLKYIVHWVLTNIWIWETIIIIKIENVSIILKFLCPFVVSPSLPLSQGNSWDFVCARILYKWDHLVFLLLCQAFFGLA